MVEKTSHTITGRILGLDIARAFAIIGMVIVNYKVTMGADGGDPEWLRMITASLDGRAAATFVVLAGIGASLGSRRARESGDPTMRERAQVTLAKRALFLFVLGWIFYPIWPADILHFYGAYLGVGALLLFASDWRLLRWAVIAVGVSFVFVVRFDFFANWNLSNFSYEGISTPVGFLRNLFLDGFHPVFPWVAFYLFGMVLGRTDLRDLRWRRRLALQAGIVVGLVETVAWFIVGPKGANLDHLGDESGRWLFHVGPIPPMPLYVVAGAATAVLVIVGSIWLGEQLPERVSRPAVATGQLALTIYLAHVIVGMGALGWSDRLFDQTLPWAVFTSLIMTAVAVGFSWAWRRSFDRGPLEWLMRRVAG